MLGPLAQKEVVILLMGILFIVVLEGEPSAPAATEPGHFFFQAQLSQTLEELGGQKQRADMVSPGHLLRWQQSGCGMPGTTPTPRFWC